MSEGSLAADVARCDGVGSDDPDEGWREGCERCLRRIAPRGETVRMMEPPPIIAFECEFLIENAEVCQPSDENRS
jgi:hypothetical protein